MDKLSDNERMHLGSEARNLIENAAFVKAVSELDATYIRAWRNAKTLEAREDAHRYMMLLNQFAADLNKMVLDGALTDKRVIELQGKRRWIG